MAITITNLTSGYGTNNPQSTSSISPTANVPVILSVGLSVNSGTMIADDNITISGCNLTWTLIARLEWGTRRIVAVYKGVGASPSSGAVSIEFTDSGAGKILEQFKWSIDELTGADSTTPFGTGYAAAGAAAEASPVTVSEAPDAGDFVFFAGGLEYNYAASLNSELDTQLVQIGDATGCRRFVTAYDSAPDSSPVPGLTWTGSCLWGSLAFIINVSSASATIEQEGFRFRNDDGSESAATWKASQDTNITLAADTAARIRMLLNATGDPASIGAQLEYRYKPSGGAFGSWAKVN